MRIYEGRLSAAGSTLCFKWGKKSYVGGQNEPLLEIKLRVVWSACLFLLASVWCSLAHHEYLNLTAATQGQGREVCLRWSLLHPE